MSSGMFSASKSSLTGSGMLTEISSPIFNTLPALTLLPPTVISPSSTSFLTAERVLSSFSDKNTSSLSDLSAIMILFSITCFRRRFSFLSCRPIRHFRSFRPIRRHCNRRRLNRHNYRKNGLQTSPRHFRAKPYRRLSRG